jgi:membrane protein
MFKTAISDFFSDNVMSMGTALAFYTALSLSPILVIIIAVAGLVGPNAQQEIVSQITNMVGPEAGGIIKTVVVSAGKQQIAGTVSAIIGLLLLLFSATGVLAQIQGSLNTIWNIEAKPGLNIKNWLTKRVISLGMLIVFGFLLMVSLALSAALSLIFSGAQGSWQAVNFIISLLVFAAMFALIYRFLPDAKIAWKDVWVGSLITAVLFDIGKYAIGKYLGVSSVGSTYGAAGSLAVLLLWIYYSSLIVFFGAELTQAYARRYGSPIEPSGHAEWIDGEKVKEHVEEKKQELISK